MGLSLASIYVHIFTYLHNCLPHSMLEKYPGDSSLELVRPMTPREARYAYFVQRRSGLSSVMI